MKHGLPPPQEQQDQAPAPGTGAGPALSSALYRRRSDDFLLRADSFNSAVSPGLFTRDSMDSPMQLPPSRHLGSSFRQQQYSAQYPQAQQDASAARAAPPPLRFAEARRAAAARQG